MARMMIDRPVVVRVASADPRSADPRSAEAAGSDGTPRRPVPTPRPAVAKARPDPRPMRLMIGLAGIAAASAMATSVITPPPSSASAAVVTVPDSTAQPVQHVTKYVQLAPGQTAPPQAAVQQVPVPTPRVVIVTTTRQSGRP
jgi:hypothetical protein